MTPRIESVHFDASIREAARRMRDLNLGMLPVRDDRDIIGTLTDRDITIRASAAGLDPNVTPISEIMSHEIFVCYDDDAVEQAARIMERYRIRRLMVQNDRGDFVGMLALADIARHRAVNGLGAEILEEVSQPPPATPCSGKAWYRE
jgi:predicted transcriptional regulator